MQARLTLHRFPARVATILISLFAALAIGGSLGYTLKPASVTSGTTRTIVVSAPPPAQGDPCVQVRGHRAC
jgi:hypothetical protein